MSGATSDRVAGVLLAGGQARRMGGGDKGLQKLGGRPIIEFIVERARPQVSALVINANGDPERFSTLGLEVVADVIEGFAGPLAGVLTGLEWARAHAPACKFVASFACDAPFVPEDLVARLAHALFEQGADMACAASAGRDHPVFGLWPVELADDLRGALVDEDIRKVDVWTARYRLARVEFAAAPVDPFFNVNRPDDFAAAEAILVSPETSGI